MLRMEFEDSRPIFQQLAENLAADILRGRYPEDSQVPSTNELAAYLRINPATAGKALGLLVDEGILVKRRGIGMFVAAGARERLAAERRERFVDDFVQPLLAAASAIGLGTPEIHTLIDRSATAQSGTDGTDPQTTE